MPSIGEERVLPTVAMTYAEPDSGDAAPDDEPDGASRYDEGPLLGRGGLGEVVEVYDRDLRRRVAVERPRDGRVDPANVRMLVREAQITAQLEHPGIPSVHALGVDATERPYFTMERLEGAPLSERTAAGPMRPAEALRLFRAIAYAVAFAHERGVLHRDIKPSNVMVGQFGQVHVVDWGIAHLLCRDATDNAVTISHSRSDRTGGFTGTPAYAAPEQIAGAALDERVDVYALGGLLYEMLAGRPAIGATDPAEARAAVTAGAVPRPGSVASVHPTLDGIVHRALAVHPDDRYASVLALVADLDAYLDGATVTAAHEDPLRRIGRLYSARSPGLRRFRWVDVDRWMASSNFVGLALGAWFAHWFAPWAAILMIVGVALFLPPVWTLVRADRPDEAEARTSTDALRTITSKDQSLPR